MLKSSGLSSFILDAKNEKNRWEQPRSFLFTKLSETFGYKRNKNLVAPDNFFIFTSKIIDVRNETYNYFPTVCFYTPELRVHGTY